MNILLAHERELIVKYCKMLVTHGLTRGTGGNISILDRKTGLFAISPSGMDYFETQPEDVPVINLADNKIADGTRKPSSEIDMHRLIYLDRDDINAVVHTHSPFATALSCTEEAQNNFDNALPQIHYLAAFAGESLRCIKYAPFGSKELAELARDGMKDRNAVLLGNHGLLAAGRDISHAFNIAEEIEFCCELYFRSKIFGTPKLLSQDDINLAIKKFNSYGQ